MKAQEFRTLSLQLAGIAPSIPLQWGRVQNDISDAKINMFSHHTFEALEKALKDQDEAVKVYFKKRWFLWKCAQCDEYLFYKHPMIQKNSNSRNQDWDFQFFRNVALRFDLKGTIIPKVLKNRVATDIEVEDIIAFYYNKQSRGVRDHIQNRLFVIHQPFKKENENVIRANFQAKAFIFKSYLEMLQQHSNYKFFTFKDKLVDLIFVQEQEDGTISFEFAALNKQNASVSVV